MAVTGWKYPTDETEITSNDTNLFFPERLGANDGSEAQAAPNTGELVDEWRWRDFGFDTGDIPDGSTIDGIEVIFEWHDTDGAALDYHVRLYDATNGESATIETGSVPKASSTTTLGGATSLWGETFDDADIRATTFGVQMYVENVVTGLQTFFADYMQVRIHYTESTGPNIDSRSGVDGADIVSISGKAIGDIVELSGVTL